MALRLPYSTVLTSGPPSPPGAANVGMSGAMPSALAVAYGRSQDFSHFQATCALSFRALREL